MSSGHKTVASDRVEVMKVDLLCVKVCVLYEVYSEESRLYLNRHRPQAASEVLPLSLGGTKWDTKVSSGSTFLPLVSNITLQPTMAL